jgi:hypothetical protein
LRCFSGERLERVVDELADVDGVVDSSGGPASEEEIVVESARLIRGERCGWSAGVRSRSRVVLWANDVGLELAVSQG